MIEKKLCIEHFTKTILVFITFCFMFTIIIKTLKNSWNLFLYCSYIFFVDGVENPIESPTTRGLRS